MCKILDNIKIFDIIKIAKGFTALKAVGPKFWLFYKITADFGRWAVIWYDISVIDLILKGIEHLRLFFYN